MNLILKVKIIVNGISDHFKGNLQGFKYQNFMQSNDK